MSLDQKRNRPHIVILLSAYNGEKYIGKQLESIADQDVAADITLFVRDDGSSDNTVLEIKKWENRLHIIWDSSTQNLKPARSFFRLLRNAPIADFYAFCDQDDVWYPDKLSKAIAEIEKNDAFLFFCNSRMVNDFLEPIAPTTYFSRPSLSIPAQMICGECQGSAMVFTDKCRDMLLHLNIDHMIMHDLTTMLYSLAFGTVIYDDAYGMDYRQHEMNVESKFNKSLLSRMRIFYSRWVKKRNLGRLQASELLDICRDRLSKEDSLFISNLVNYKKSLKSKRYILKNAGRYCDYPDALRSFKLRILFHLY